MLRFVLFAVYYLLIPAGLIAVSWKLWNDVGYLDIVQNRWDKNRGKKDIRKARTIAQKTSVIFTAFILVALPLWGFSSSEFMDEQIRHEVIGGTVFNPAIIDPVIHSLGPSYDSEYIIEQMKENPGRWHFEEIDEKVNFDELTSVPGRLAVYTLRDRRIIVTYTYLAPFPIVRAFGFRHREIEGPEGEPELLFLVEREKTYLFPLNPGNVGEVADF